MKLKPPDNEVIIGKALSYSNLFPFNPIIDYKLNFIYGAGAKQLAI